MRARAASAFVLALLAVLVGPDVVAHFPSDGQIASSALRFYLSATRLWLLLAAAAVALPRGRVRRATGVLLYTLSVFGLLEVSSAIAYRGLRGAWHFWELSQRDAMVAPHPYLVGLPTPGRETTRKGVTICQNSLGFRGPAPAAPRLPGVRRVVAIGGSSTYCIGVSEGATWPEQLGRGLGAGWEVLNLGSPGHSSAEHVILSALRLSDLAPDVALVYCGWNDARNFGIRDLASDYSDYHGRQQYDALLLPRIWTGPDLALMRVLTPIFQRAGWWMKLPSDDLKIAADHSPAAQERALALYRRNLTVLAATCRAQGITPVFLPQVMNCAALTRDRPYGWLPFVDDNELCGVLRRYNDVMREVARDERVACVDDLDRAEWDRGDFIDQGHLSPAGCIRFAERLRPTLRELGVDAPP